MPSKYRAMIFDMDGTLLDSMFYWRTIWREYIEAHNLVMPEELKDKVLYGCGKSCALIARDNAMDKQALYRGMLEEMLGKHYREDVQPKPLAGDVLAKLKGEGYIVAVATATPRHLAEPALARHGLLEHVDLVTDVDEMGAQKSAPEFFLNVAKRLGVKPEECVMFEDAVYAMRSAKAAGMTVYAIDDPISWPDRTEIKALADRYLLHWGELTGGEPPRYRNIVLDCGNVVTVFDLPALCRLFCENEEDSALLLSAADPQWGPLDTGLYPEEELLARCRADLPKRLHEAAGRLFREWVYHMPYVEGMPELIRELRDRHYHLFLLSNAPVRFAETLHFYKIFDLFDGLVVSAPLKLVKPDRAIFNYLLETYALDPARTLFVDDIPHNVEGARACGIDAYRFTGDTEALRRYILDK